MAPWLLVGWFVLPALSRWLFLAIRALADREPAGQASSTQDWLEGRLGRLGLGHVTVDRGPAGLDAFAPLHDVILLDARTARSRGLVSRAIGAHELGHAWFHRARAAGTPLRLLRLVWTAAMPLQRALLAGCLIHGGPRDALAAVLAVGLGSAAAVLLDELVASAVAMVVLARELPRGQLAGAALALLGALSTYLAPAAADLLLFLHRDALPVPAFHAAARPGWALTAGLIAATVVIGFTGLRSILLVLGSPAMWARAKEEAAVFAALFFLAVTWNRVTTPVGQLLFALALPMAWRGAMQVAGSVLGPIVAGLPALHRWARARQEDGNALAMLGLAQLAASHAQRALVALPWALLIAFVARWWLGG